MAIRRRLRINDYLLLDSSVTLVELFTDARNGPETVGCRPHFDGFSN